MASILDSMSAAATGCVVVGDPLNFWGGKRVEPRQDSNAEPVFEPATGTHHTGLMLHPKEEETLMWEAVQGFFFFFFKACLC